MIRITKTSGISSIKIYTKETMDPGYNGGDIDSFIIIPGVTQYKHIYSTNKYLIFDSIDNYIGVEFNSIADLERYFVQLMRDIKINQITNVSVDFDTKSN